jgi:hypothetical protein
MKEDPRKIQAKSKFSQIYPNPSKSSQAQPREKLGFPCPNRALSKTCADPRAFILLLARSARIASAASNHRAGGGVFLFSMSVSFNNFRAAALFFLECIMAQIPTIRKDNVNKALKGPEFRAFGDASLVRGAVARARQVSRADPDPRATPNALPTRRRLMLWRARSASRAVARLLSCSGGADPSPDGVGPKRQRPGSRWIA